MSLFEETDQCDLDIIPLRRMIPDFYFDPNDDTTDKFVDIFQGVFCQWLKDIDGLNKIYDLDETDERFLDMIIRNLGFDLNVSLTVDKKRKLAKIIVQAYKQKGTCPGVENTIRQFVGVDSTCFAFTDGWILDVSELSEDTYLNPSPENVAGFYTFDVIVEQKLSAEQRRIIIDLVNLIKPAHSHFRSLVEEGVNAFVLDITRFVNRASLYLYRTQNNDGGWDVPEDDGSLLNTSGIDSASYQGLGEYFAYLFNTELVRVNETFEEASLKLINDAIYSFAGTKPIDGDITLLNKAEASLVPGAAAKRNEALTALYEFMKATAFLTNYAATSVQILATTQPERDSTSLRNRAKFLYLWLTNTYSLAEGIHRYVRYVKDFKEFGNEPQAIEMATELNFRVGGINLEIGFGSEKLKGCAAVAIGLQMYNTGFIYELKILECFGIIEATYQTIPKIYVDSFFGSGTLLEQALILELLMARGKYDQSKLLLSGLKLLQRTEGSVDDPINAGTRNLKNLGIVLEMVSKSIKRIEDEGL